LGVVDALPGRRVRLVAVGVARSAPQDDIAVRLVRIAAEVEAWLDEHEPDAVAIERVFAQHNVRTVMGTAQVSGVIMVAAARRGLPVALHTPSEVKAAVTGHGRAPKDQVGQMVARILGLAEPPSPADAADALALAICHLWRPTVPTSAPPGTATVTSTRGASAGTANAGWPGPATAGRGTAATPAQQAWARAEVAARRAPR